MSVANLKDHSALATWCKDENISMVVVGPEDPLAAGMADTLKAAGSACILFVSYRYHIIHNEKSSPCVVLKNCIYLHLRLGI